MDMSLLMSMMMGTGAGMNQQPWSQNLNQIGQNALGASNIMKWMQQMLGKEGTKMTVDNKGWSMKGTNEAMKSIMGSNPTQGNQMGGGNINPVAAPTGLTAAPGGPVPVPGATPPAPALTEPFNNPAVNPSSSPLAAPGLGGLTPQAMTSMYQTALGYKELERRTASDWLAYNAQTQTNQLRAFEEMRKWAELMRPGPVSIPGLGNLSLDEFKALPSDVQAYAYYAFYQQQHGDEVLSPVEWKRSMSPDSIVEQYKYSQTDAGFLDFLSKRFPKMEVNVGERTKEAAQARQEASFTDPEFFAKTYKTAEEQTTYAEANAEAVEKGIPYNEGRIRVIKKNHLKLIDQAVRVHFADKVVTFDPKTGWYVDGKIVAKQPYAVQ